MEDREHRHLHRWHGIAPVRLPAKLAAAAVCAAIAALVIMGVAGLPVARSYLVRRADSQLRTYANALVTGVIKVTASGGIVVGGLGHGLVPAPAHGFVPGPAPGFVPGPADGGRPGIEVLGPGGALLTPLRHRPIPAAPAYLASISTRAGMPVSVPAGRGQAGWRVIAEPIHYQARHIPFVYGEDDFFLTVTSPAKPGLPGILVVGTNSGRARGTVGSITAAVLGVAAVVIVLLACAVAVLTRVRLRPLTGIEQTAGAIASGEPWRHVPSRDLGGDAGSLARSLNTALDQAELSLSTSADCQAASRQSAERMRQAITDACLQVRTSLRVIHGLAVSWRRRGTVPADELDRMMQRVDEEAARIASLVDDLAHPNPDPQPGPAPGPAGP